MKLKRENPVSVRKVSSNNDFEALKDAWNGLLDNSPADCFFLRWEWLWSWWKAYEDETTELSILLFFRREELIGIGPFYLSKHSWKGVIKIRSLMFLGTEMGGVISEYMDIIYRQGEEGQVFEALVNFIAEENLCDNLDLQKIVSTSPTIELLKKYARKKNYYYFTGDNFEVPYIMLTGNMDTFFQTLSSSMRYKIKRNSKKIIKFNDFIFHNTENSLELERDFTELVRLHQMRWESRNQSGAFSDKKFFCFQKSAMEKMLENGTLKLSFLSVSGRNIASQYNISYKDKLYFYQGGIDASFYRNLSPGYLMHAYCIGEAIKNGLKEYDFLVADKENTYKKHWAKDCRYMMDVNIACRRSYKLYLWVMDRVKLRGIRDKA